MTEQALQQRERVAHGLCRACAQDAAEGRTYCGDCLGKMRVAAAERYRLKRGTVRALRCKRCGVAGHNRTSCTGSVPRCEAVILRGVLRRCGEPADWRIETDGHADTNVCDACKNVTLSALMRAGYQARIVPVSDGERRARP